MNNTIKLLAEKYNQVVLSEMQQKYIDMVKEVKKDLPFDNIFGKNLRIILPFSQNQTYNELKSEISNLPGFVQWNPDKKEVIRKVHYRKPNGEEGTKDQILNIGKAISLLKIAPEKKKEYLNWFSNYSSNIQELEEMSKYSIILSRHPIDVVRMSDAKKLYSCHSEGNEYFQCAIQEAKTGGPIAYVVKTDDLKQIDPKKLQTDEIFADKLRNIDGIIPLSRVRIRRYVDDNEINYAIPEGRIYGENIPGFVNTVKNILKEKQKDIINPTELIKKFKERKIYKRGGTYSDSSDSELFNKFLDTNELFQSLYHYKSDVAEEEKNLKNIDELQARMDQELSDIKSDFNYTFSNVTYEVFAVDDYAAYAADGTTRIGILSDEIKKLDLSSFLALHNDIKIFISRRNTPSFEVEKTYKVDVIKIFDLIKNFLEISNIDLDDIASIEFRKSKNIESNLYIKWVLNKGESNIAIDDFEVFCDKILYYDDRVNELEEDFEQALIKIGYLIQTKNLTNYKKFKIQELEFDYFSYNQDEIEGYSFIPIRLSPQQFSLISDKKEHIEYLIVTNIFDKYSEFLSKNKRIDNQLSFKQFSESWTSYQKDFSLTAELIIENKASIYDNSTKSIKLRLQIKKIFNNFKPIVIDFMIDFDKIFEDYCKHYVVAFIYRLLPDKILSSDQLREKNFYLRTIS